MPLGKNRALLNETQRLARTSKICIFISHQKRDRDACEKIANYILSIGIDVYFDEYDYRLSIASQKGDAKGVVAAIRKGIDSSSHMLCVISPNTLGSKWVPFEVGYGYEKTSLASLTLKGIKNSDLPEYIRIAPIIRDLKDLNKFIKEFENKLILERRNIIGFDSWNHPLSTVMDKY